ncbi:MAG: hypothetical protein ACLUEK_08040 [Oscillospiraceae bacterium]
MDEPVSERSFSWAGGQIALISRSELAVTLLFKLLMGEEERTPAR